MLARYKEIIMLGLEYMLYFGVPSNKLELWHGFSQWKFPFRSRESAEEHFQHWMETLCRWKQVDSIPDIYKSERRWATRVKGIKLDLFPRPILFRFPIDHRAFDAFYNTFHRRDFWPCQPAGLETGWDWTLDEMDIRLNIYQAMRGLAHRHGGLGAGQVAISLSDTAGVEPTGYYYRQGRTGIEIEGDYFQSPPDLIAEMMTASSRSLNRGARMELYRRHGVEHLWLCEPALETLEVYRLEKQYALQGVYGMGDSITNEMFPGTHIRVDKLFDTQLKRHNRKSTEPEEPPPLPEWLLPSEMPLGLEYFFLMGHPQRRWEFWGNRTHSILAFGSVTEACARLDHFLTEASCWEGLPKPTAGAIADDVDQAEVGRFRFTRRGRSITLNVAVDGKVYKDLLSYWSKYKCWDWGEKKKKRK